MYKEKKGKNKILGIVGSPRRGGNTDLLVDEILKGAKESGAETEKVFLYKLKINPCDGCNVCFKNKNGNCKYEDDFAVVKKKMEESSTWIIGTPVYWWGPTAIMKAFIDRWYQHNITSQFFRDKSMILVVASGGESESYSRHVVGMMEDITKYVGLVLKDKIICTGVGKRGDVNNRPDVLEKALNAGRKIFEKT
ncbi:MAG: flavodoxin family protein [Candidatus Hodarchaeales archaeon]